jgi:hypothetical protein
MAEFNSRHHAAIIVPPVTMRAAFPMASHRADTAGVNLERRATYLIGGNDLTGHSVCDVRHHRGRALGPKHILRVLGRRARKRYCLN